MADQIAKTTQSLTTAANMRETTKMLMQPNANWEEYLTPAPLSIAIMGELVFISSCEDFSINENPPQGGFEYIKYPTSFRACLMQVCNSGWQAFNEAHKNMDQIRIHTGAVPDYMKTAVNVLFNASDEVIKTLLPNQLKSIRDIAEECVILAKGVEKKYLDVINLIQELLEACVNAKHFYGDELEKVKMKLEEAKLREQTAKQLKESSKKAMEDLSKELDDAQDAYKSAMNTLPSGLNMIAMDLVEGITSGITATINGLTSWMGKSGKVAQSPAACGDADAAVDGLEQKKVCSKSEEMLQLMRRLKNFVRDGKIDWRNLYDQKKKRCTKAIWIQTQFDRINQELLNLPFGKLRESALSICENSIYICEELETYSPEGTWDDKQTKNVVENINKVHEDALKFDSKSKKILGSPALSPKPPMMYREQSSSENASASQDLVEGITSGITATISGLTSRMGKSVKAAQSSAACGDADAAVNGLEQIRVCSKSEEMLQMAGRLKNFVQDGKIDWGNLYDQKNKSCTTAIWIQTQFDRINQELLNLPFGKLHERALSICENSIYICEELETYSPEGTWDDKQTENVVKNINKVHEDALKFDSKSKKILGSPALSPKPPMMFREQKSSENASASQRASDNARYRIELSREQLKHTRESYQKSVENMEKNERELTEILCEMQNCNIKQMDFDTTIKMLVKGLDAMGRVKEQWEKMVRFFQMVSNIVKTSLDKTLKNFVTTCEDSTKLSYNNKLFTKDLLYNQAFQASNIASLVHMISGTYTEVSSKFLMDRVSSLGRLMAMDSSKPEFHQERLMLQESCQQAQRGILQLVIKNKKDFERKTDERMEKIEYELKAILPAAPPQETENIKEIVQASFEEQEDYT